MKGLRYPPRMGERGNREGRFALRRRLERGICERAAYRFQPPCPPPPLLSLILSVRNLSTTAESGPLPPPAVAALPALHARRSPRPPPRRRASAAPWASAAPCGAAGQRPRGGAGARQRGGGQALGRPWRAGGRRRWPRGRRVGALAAAGLRRVPRAWPAALARLDRGGARLCVALARHRPASRRCTRRV
jgi:hypothetical protein